MNRRLPLMALFALGSVLLALFFATRPAQAIIPSDIQYVKYIPPNNVVEYWGVTNEEFVQNTLPNEWLSSWSDTAWRAGAVIIRSEAYWRTNRTILGSPYPNNNCYKLNEGGYTLYLTAPLNKGGHENFIPQSETSKSISATSATYRYHAERVSLPSGRPDKLVSLRYNSVIQSRTQSGSGTWLQRIRYAYNGAGHPGWPYNPNAECNQTDSHTNSDPVYPNF